MGRRRSSASARCCSPVWPSTWLYVPETWPGLPPAIAGATYAERAAQVIGTFTDDDIDEVTLLRLCREAYATFRHPAVVPLVQLGDRHFVQELFHGPTLAFKDVALQLVGRLFDHVLGERGQRVTIVGATSGDTGSAAIDGVRGCDNVDIVILFPRGRTSEVQRRQMTTVDAPNVRVVAVDGTFDDCQDLVKAMFTDVPFREPDGVERRELDQLGEGHGPGRLLRRRLRPAQRPADVQRADRQLRQRAVGLDRTSDGCADRGLRDRLDSNDILSRFVNDNDMTTAEVVPSLSPSMDIQVSSNFERLLFEMNGRDGGLTAEQLQRFRVVGRLDVEADQRAEYIDGVFRAASLDDAGDARGDRLHVRDHRHAPRPPQRGGGRRCPPRPRQHRRLAGHRAPREVP